MDIKDESYYSDFYDVRTIEECLRAIERARETIPADVSEKDKEKTVNFLLYWIKGNRYENKSSFVMGCMSRDRARKELFERCRAPENVRCPNCSVSMTVMLKELYELEDPARVLFFMECPKCKKRKGIFDNGTERKPKPETCPQCSGRIKTRFIEKEGGAVWQKDCPSCHFSETEIDDFEISRTERIEREKQE
jgi:Zn finger protein HypA/HybF involved in hydrogenase expression